MRHLLVTNDFAPKVGGIQSYLWELWRRLPDPDEITVLTTPHPDAAAFDAAQPFRVVRTREPVLLPNPPRVRRVKELASETRAELVVLDPALPAGGIGPWLGPDLPYAVVMHGSELLGRLPVGSPLMGQVLRRAVHVIAAGSYPAAEIRRAIGRGRPTPPITEIPPGVDAQRFRPLAGDDAKRAARRQLGLPENGPVVLGLSRLVRRKGFDVLIDAGARLRTTGVTIAIGGSGRDRPRLEQRVRSDNVVFLGRVSDDDLPAAYGCADAFAMLCRDQWGGLEQEGFGIVFVEAAACGTPQIAGRSGGSADAVVHGETGLVLDEPRDVDGVTAAIEHVLDPATNAAMRERSRERVERELTYDVLAERLAKALTTVR